MRPTADGSECLSVHSLVRPNEDLSRHPAYFVYYHQYGYLRVDPSTKRMDINHYAVLRPIVEEPDDGCDKFLPKKTLLDPEFEQINRKTQSSGQFQRKYTAIIPLSFSLSPCLSVWGKALRTLRTLTVGDRGRARRNSLVNTAVGEGPDAP